MNLPQKAFVLETSQGTNEDLSWHGRKEGEESNFLLCLMMGLRDNWK